MPATNGQRETASAFARALNRIIRDNRFTVKEMAEEAECSDRHLYNVADLTHPADLSTHKSERLARWLCSHGERRLSEVFLSADCVIGERMAGRADGDAREEIVKLVKAAALSDEGIGERNIETLDRAITLVREALADLEAEQKALL